ncbi:hypothetical protein IWW37_005173 [Coemansia sp. RSA 2050]|nr:hypothetical protein IWW37_005173 [Coemansia sp. RSA 2050]
MKYVVSSINRVDSYTKLQQFVGKKLTLIFTHNSSNSSEADFFDKCNEFLKKAEPMDLGVLWCDYTAFSSKFEAEHADNELRICIVGLYMDTKYVSVMSAAGFASAVEDAIESDFKAKPMHVNYGTDNYSWPKCMCCCGSHDNVMNTREKNVNSVASLLKLIPLTQRAVTSCMEDSDSSDYDSSDYSSAQETKETVFPGEKEDTVDTPP